MMTELKFLAIDATSILRTNYEANPAPDSLDKADGAIRSAMSTFRNLLIEQKPTHVLFAFDFDAKNWRHLIYPEYKAGRTPMPWELRSKIPELFKMISEDIGIRALEVEGYEAEDLISTAINRWSHGNGGSKIGMAVIVSKDKDLIPEIAEGVLLYDHYKKEWRDEAYVQNRFNIPSRLFADYLALVGDDSDGIPGVSKVGDKTAAKWLNDFGSIAGILANADTIKGVVGDNLRKERDLLLLCRKLVQLEKEAHLGITWNMLAITQPIMAKKPDQKNGNKVENSVEENMKNYHSLKSATRFPRPK
jgi:protein Xni